MRVIDCDCGAVVQAANDDDLRRRMRDHLDEDHPDMDLDDAAIEKLVAERAYSATDS